MAEIRAGCRVYYEEPGMVVFDVSDNLALKVEVRNAATCFGKPYVHFSFDLADRGTSSWLSGYYADESPDTIALVKGVVKTKGPVQPVIDKLLESPIHPALAALITTELNR